MNIKSAIAALAAAVAAPAVAAPAMWAISDADSTVYLFGTSHAVRPGAQWQTPAMDAALKDATTLWLEMKFPDPAAGAAIMQKLGLDSANPLPAKLPEATAKKLDAFAAANGLPSAQLAPMRPWLAAVTVGRIALRKSGLDSKAGADLTLKAAAEIQGDNIDGFDTAEQQARYLADLPDEEQIAFLDRTLDRVGDISIAAATAEAWEKGDLDAIEGLINKELKAESALVYERLNAERNRRYASSIRELLAGKDTHFVAVGAGHVAGPDGIPALLAAEGVTIRRVQ